MEVLITPIFKLHLYDTLYWPVSPSQMQEHAFESSQKYKEGKYIIELAHMIKENGWD